MQFACEEGSLPRHPELVLPLYRQEREHDTAKDYRETKGREARGMRLSLVRDIQWERKVLLFYGRNDVQALAARDRMKSRPLCT